ncbi:MAG: nucleotide sugar dehydrogenase [Candidatus Poribacteria bacterium]|nr:nucleotide sugar dehydrogenase [Candidatus Poribacteria bacterium]
MIKKKIADRTAHAGVIGLGYVGLPLALTIAKSGFSVTGIDVNQRKVEHIQQGISDVADVPSEDLGTFVQRGQIQATTDYHILSELDTVNICVPTPLRKSKDPDMSFIISAVDAIAQYLRQDQLIILESTTYPGTTEEIVLPKLEERGLQVGKDFFLAFSPERIDPGNQTYSTVNTPKIVGGVTPACTEVAQLFYEQFIHEVQTVSSPRTAEMVKLLENTFRSVNIGLVNEMALMCDRMKLDVWEIVDAAATKPFGFMPFYPGPGLGGHCIPVDPHYLSWKAKTYEFYARFIELASEINGSMPEYVLDKITDALNRHRKAINGSKILMMGVAYKRDVGDVRESPAIDVIRMVAQRGGEIFYHDPYVPELEVEELGLIDGSPARYACQELTEALVNNVDCVAIMTDHTGIDYSWLVDHAAVVVDTRNATKSVTTSRSKIIKI